MKRIEQLNTGFLLFVINVFEILICEHPFHQCYPRSILSRFIRPLQNYEI